MTLKPPDKREMARASVKAIEDSIDELPGEFDEATPRPAPEPMSEYSDFPMLRKREKVPPRLEPIRLVVKEEAAAPKQKANPKDRGPMDSAVTSKSLRTIGKAKAICRIGGLPPIVLLLSPCSRNARRIIDLLRLRVFAKEDPRFYDLETNAGELSALLHLKRRLNREEADALLHEVLITYIRFIEEGGARIEMPVLGVSRFDPATGEIQLKLNEDLRPLLLNVRGGYTIRASILDLRSNYGAALYDFLRRFWWQENERDHRPKPGRATLAELCRTLLAPKTPWRLFRRDVLEPAIKDIEERTEFRVEYQPERQGSRERGEPDAILFQVRECKTPTKALRFRTFEHESPRGAT